MRSGCRNRASGAPADPGGNARAGPAGANGSAAAACGVPWASGLACAPASPFLIGSQSQLCHNSTLRSVTPVTPARAEANLAPMRRLAVLVVLLACCAAVTGCGKGHDDKKVSPLDDAVGYFAKDAPF